MNCSLNRISLFTTLVLGLTLGSTLLHADDTTTQGAPTGNIAAAGKSDESNAKADAEIQKKASDWVSALKLTNSEQAARVEAVIATHLRAVRDWHNTHPYTIVPEGINPGTGKPLTKEERQFIASSSIPKSVHTDLMGGLAKDLNAEQVEAILDKYTVGKVAFTMAGYKAIVPDLSSEEEATILGYLKTAREQAVDFKNMKLISAVFEIYKTKSEQYLNSKGRNWKQLFKAYTDGIKAKKAADAAAKAEQK